MSRYALIPLVLAVGLSGAPARLSAQGGLDAAVDRARSAWLTHDVRALLGSSDTVRLRLPGLPPAQSLRPNQAARLLAQYLENAEEVGLELREIRYVADDHAYAELLRTHRVRGTDDGRLETLFFGFRRVGAVWRLREVRATP